MCFWCYILEKYPKSFGGQKWDFEALSGTVCFDCLKEHFDDDWNIYYISSYTEFPWDSIVHDDIGNFRVVVDDFELVLYTDGFLKNRNVPLEYMESYPGLKWDKFTVIQNKNLTPDFVEKYPEGFLGWPWDLVYLGGSKLLTPEFIEKHPDGFLGRKWYFQKIILNENFPWDFFTKTDGILPLTTWTKYMKEISKIAPFDFVRDNLYDGFFGHRWDNVSLILNKNIPIDFIRSNIMCSPKEYMGELLSRRKDLPWDLFLSKSASFDIYANYLSINPALPMFLLESHPDGINGKWDLKAIAQNAALTWDFVEAHPDGFCGQKWDFSFLCCANWEKDLDQIRYKKTKLATI